ncbi:MAG: hypothetical protein JWP34_5211, partial [Massilia sp.]|nr:hypothetical protein [Massilia sp.]
LQHPRLIRALPLTADETDLCSNVKYIISPASSDYRTRLQSLERMSAEFYGANKKRPAPWNARVDGFYPEPCQRVIV